jgi:nucleotide-binding universal stress UspA family protein
MRLRYARGHPAPRLRCSAFTDPSYLLDVPQLVERVTQRTEGLVQRAAGCLEASGIEATPLVLSGDPKAVIVDRAGAMRADFVVIGAHRSGGVTRFLLGSVARAVLRFSPCSAEVVRAKMREDGGRRGMKVLLAIDGSECSLNAACSIAGRPWPSGTEIRILCVIELAVPTFQAPYPSSTMETLRSEAMKRSQAAIIAAEEILIDVGLQA